MTTVLVQDLITARDFIAKGFCKHAAALDANGMKTFSDTPGVVAHCSVGACWAARRQHYCEIGDMTNALHAHLPEEFKSLRASDLEYESWSGRNDYLRHADVVNFNNHEETTQADVVALFDKAIETAKGMPDDIK